MKKNNTNRLFLFLVAVFVLASIGAVIVVSIYFIQFSGEFGNQEAFGQFGDFVGGALSPFLSFLTVILLLLSVWYQRQELNNVTCELEHIRHVHQENLNMRHYEYIVKTNQEENSDFNYAKSLFVSNLYESFEVEITVSGNLRKLKTLTVFDILNQGTHNNILKMMRDQKSADRINAGKDIQSILDSMSSAVETINQIIEQLYSLGCPKYMAKQLLTECSDLIKEYFFDQSALFKAQLQAEIKPFEKLRSNVASYPEYPSQN